jgi:hypothetical protein
MDSGLAAKIVAATVTLVIVYYFIVKADETSRVIKSLSSAYVDSVKVLQGR